MFPEIAGTIPGWITSLGVVSILALVVRRELGLRKLRNDDEVNIRDHYAAEVRALRERMDAQSIRHAATVQTIDRRLNECHDERDGLRDDSRTLKDIVAGLIRIITQASASKAILLDSRASDYVRDAALRIDSLFAPVNLAEPEENPE